MFHFGWRRKTPFVLWRVIALNRWARYLFMAHTHTHHHHSAERTHVSIISYWVGNWVTLRTSSYVFQCTTELRSIAQSFHLLDWAEKKLVNRLFYFPKCSFLGWSFGYDHVRLAGFIVVCSLAGWLVGWDVCLNRHVWVSSYEPKKCKWMLFYCYVGLWRKKRSQKTFVHTFVFVEKRRDYPRLDEDCESLKLHTLKT